MGDVDLVAGNIKAGINLFGVSGNSNVVNSSSGDAASATIQFGKKAWVDGIEITGYLPGDTITDTTTGLI